MVSGLELVSWILVGLVTRCNCLPSFGPGAFQFVNRGSDAGAGPRPLSRPGISNAVVLETATSRLVIEVNFILMCSACQHLRMMEEIGDCILKALCILLYTPFSNCEETTISEMFRSQGRLILFPLKCGWWKIWNLGKWCQYRPYWSDIYFNG